MRVNECDFRDDQLLRGMPRSGGDLAGSMAPALIALEPIARKCCSQAKMTCITAGPLAQQTAVGGSPRRQRAFKRPSTPLAPRSRSFSHGYRDCCVAAEQRGAADAAAARERAPPRSEQPAYPLQRRQQYQQQQLDEGASLGASNLSRRRLGAAAGAALGATALPLVAASSAEAISAPPPPASVLPPAAAKHFRDVKVRVTRPSPGVG